MTIIKSALVQTQVGVDRDANLKNAKKFIEEAAKGGAKLICLPECFNSPYGVKFFDKYAECVPNGPTCEMLSNVAKDNQIYLVGGTIPEIYENKYYNTCTVWNPCGEMIAKYRKIHLFDIDIPGGITFKESDILSPGKELATFCIDDVKIGLGICYDMRFEELAKLYRLMGCSMIIYPGAFNMTTGPMHWELLQRGRALDNQIYVCAISPARGTQGYIAWGHSQFTNPWGKVICQADHTEKVVHCDLDFKECDVVRQQIPIFKQRRCDVYDTINKIN
ncbi:PREDICTED: omega-amidase NIT2 [Nicrophorus vespilloides]|uniref:omega-amidase n=1 Tax=Nicrophorus vespilloides TaxID=110193 RepID=A0ABM1N4J7_NICVS|nr:PREDICTED: omega-amidase NIT2 [Nicrophorus vespilloides]